MYKENHRTDPPTFGLQFDAGETVDTLDRLIEGFHDFGEVFRIYSPTRRNYTYVISNPELIKRVLSTNHKNYQKGVGIDRVAVLLGKGLMVSEGEFWRQQRHMVQPFLHRRAIHHFFSVIHQCTADLVEAWQGPAERSEPVNITEEISEITLRAVLLSIFSQDLAELEKDHPFAVVSEESSRDLMFAAKFRALTRPVRALIDRRRQDKLQRDDLLQMLMYTRDKTTGQPMTDKALVDEVMTLIVAGHETTASSLNWLWYLVSEHQEVAQKIRDEIQTLAVDHLGEPSKLLQLNYLKAVVDETLRLYPPGWLLTRRALADDRFGQYKIPAGADIFISPYLVHRHPDYWPEPESFDPDRFYRNEQTPRHAFAYLPFGGGPRRCVGDAFAAAEMQVHVAVVAQHFILQNVTKDPVEMEALVNLRSKHPFHMLLERVP